MSATRTVFIGSLYALNRVGVDQLVERIRSNYPDDPASAPFVAYDYENNLLSCNLDRGDSGTPQFLLAQYKLFTDHERKNPQVIDSAIRPLEGALVRTEIDYSNTHYAIPGLLDVGVDELGAADPLEALDHFTTYWRPRDGDIKILTTTIAERIATLTGCSIYPEPLESRVRLVGGDFSTALRKLENLESLLALQYQQREFTTIKTNGNVLLKTTDNANPVMEFERVNNPKHPAYRRIIFEQGPQVLQGKCIGELRISGVPKEDSIPINLMPTGIAETKTVGRYGAWDRFIYGKLGDENNKNPRKVSDMEFNVPSSPSSKVGINAYIDLAKAARVASWSGQVDENVDPNNVTPEIPEQPTTRRRLVAAESDDEDEDGPDQAIPMNEATMPPIPDKQEPKPEVNSANQVHRHSVLGGLAPFNLLRDEDSEDVASMVPGATMLEVMPLSSAEPEVFAGSRRHIVQTDSNTDLSEGDRDELDEVQASFKASPHSVLPTNLSTQNQTTKAYSVTRPESIGNSITYITGDQTGMSRANDYRETSPPSLAQKSPGTWATFDGTASKLAPSPEIHTKTPSSAQKSLENYGSAMIWPPMDFDLNAYDGAKGLSRNSSWDSSNGKPSTTCRNTSPTNGLSVNHHRSAAIVPKIPTLLTGSASSSERLQHIPAAKPTISSSSFDPQAYGARTRGSRGPQTIQSTTKLANRGTTSKVPPGLGQVATFLTQVDTAIGRPGPHRRGTRYRGRANQKDSATTAAGETAQIKQNKLIDVEDSEPASREPLPPPGFEYRSPTSLTTEWMPCQSPHLLDEPMEHDMEALEVQGKIRKSPMQNSGDWMPVSETHVHVPEPSSHAPVPQTSHSDLISFSSSSKPPLASAPASNLTSIIPASIAASEESANYVNKVAYKGPNIAYLKSASLAKLHAMKEAADTKKAETQAAKATGSKSKGHKGGKSRPTMTQQAGNPGKKGPQKQESKAEKKKRTEQALREAYSNTSPIKSQHSDSQEAPDISKKRSEISQPSPKVIIAHFEDCQVDSRRKASEQLVLGLDPIFEASRAFSGEVQFQIQLGQLLISHDSDVRDKTITAKKWEKLFGQAAKVPILSAFTSALTTNGADIDRALEVRAFRGGKLWDATSPGPWSVSYEFECQSKHGKEFLIVLDQFGNFELRSSSIATIGMIGLHAPAQVWDACAILCGVENWTAPAEVEATVGAFVRSIHVLPNRHELALVFRQPEDNEIMVRNVKMRRVSHHHCLITGYQDYQLEVTEVKSLYTKVHPEDKKLWQAYEKSHIDMMQDGLLHYQISINDKQVNEVLAHNQTLELGELMDPSAGKTLLKVERIKQMVDITAQMVSKIDWMGSRNNGTLARAAAIQQVQEIRQKQSLPPMARSKIVPLMMGTRIDPSRVGGAVSTMGGGASEVLVGRMHLPGTRSGTLAEIYEDQYGLFAKGFGGARVPVLALGTLGSISEVPLEPNDSASQMGGVARKPGLGASGMASTAGGRRLREFHGDKGPGYW